MEKDQFSFMIVGGDAIAEPLYAFVGEVFDMRGVFKILRKVNWHAFS